jgi:hypothetical protein
MDTATVARPAGSGNRAKEASAVKKLNAKTQRRKAW